ncbi:DNA ligase [Allorhizocola rhizosphaerae]|uniref:ATP dependent DNA ligase n=1 Tax=Allorhizocola rhizosphaerae TaxID=1872709 RepID=UPI001FEB74E3|nr:DNA ligase [Allorhizocola rhizosphaerae]
MTVPIRPMFATPGPLPSGPGWAYEVKWDGYRAIYQDGRYYGRSGLQLSGPPLGVSVEAPIDGELVAFGPDGRVSFQAMQRTVTPAFIAFDIIVPDLTYAQRREILEQLDLTISPRFDDGPATVAAARELGLEGVIAKRLDSPYRPGARSPDWVKYKFVRTGDFVIGGWRPGARPLGALLIGTPSPRGLIYRGRVGGGITAGTEATLLPVLHELARPDSPFAGQAERGNYVEPVLVVEVRYGEITRDGRLRFPVFLRLRPDLLPSEVVDES